jgi:predicted transcriptional regulator
VTERPNEVAAIAKFARDQWPVVLIAALTGAVVAGAWAYWRAPDPGFVATQRVRVATGVVGVPNAPTVDGVISAVGSSIVRQSAAESLGISPAALGAVSASIDGKNTSVVVVSARRPSKEDAPRIARAVAEAARESVLSLVDPNLEYQRTTLEAQQRRIQELQARLTDLRAQVADARTAALEKVMLEQSLTDVGTLIYTAEDRADAARLALSQTERYVLVDGEPTVAQGASTGYLVSSVIRGLLLGLLAGLGIAWVRYRAGSRGVRA